MSNKPAWYLERHQNVLEDIKHRAKMIQLVFIGDSIVASWEDKGADVWAKYFAPYGAINLGFAGDCTEDVIWRIENHQLDGLAPVLVILKIGTNNTGHRRDSATKTTSDIKIILDLIKKRLPGTHILLHALMPRGRTTTSPLRRLNNEINEKLKLLAEQASISWLDLGDMFLDEDGIIQQDIMHDALHPNASQYPLWAEALLPHIKGIFEK